MKHEAVLVTGGAGFIGSSFVEMIIAKGRKVIVLDKLTYAGHPDNLKHLPAQSYKLVIGDIGNAPLVQSLLQKHHITAVFNLAAESHVDNSIAGPEAFIETNVRGVFHLLQACQAYFTHLPDSLKPAFRFIQVSTDEVYGSLGAEGAFTEASQINPNSPYSATKAAGDHLARAWRVTYGLPVITTHCSNNYGPRQHPEKLIPNIISKALAGEKLPVYGDGSNVRDWIQVEDHCHGIWLAYTKGSVGETYNFGGNAEVDNLSLVKRICTILDQKRPGASGKSYAEQIAFVTDRLGHDRRYAIDDRKACEQLGFSRKHTLEEGLLQTVDWYLANQDWCNMMRKKT